MACSTRYINYNHLHVSTRHQEHVTLCDPTYLLVLLERDYDEHDGYVHLQDYTHSSIDVNIQNETTDNRDISF